jgi:hypothetical protein
MITEEDLRSMERAIGLENHCLYLQVRMVMKVEEKLYEERYPSNDRGSA